MGYKENRKRTTERWGGESNGRSGRMQWKKAGSPRLVGAYGMPVYSDNFDIVTIPQYLQGMGDNRALKFTQDLIDEIKTRWLINPVPQDFKTSGMVYFADQIAEHNKRKTFYVGENTEVTTRCINPKRGLWRVYIKAW